MHKLYELKDKLMNELEEYADNGKFSKDDVEAIKYTASAIDHICNICEDDGEYSEAGGMMGNSYARGGRGGNYGRRTMRGGRTGANQYGSYARGYSRAEDGMNDLLSEMDSMIPSLPDEKRREAQRFIDRMRGM